MIVSKLTASAHPTAALLLSVLFRYLGKKLQAAISLVQYLFVLKFPFIMRVSDVQPNASSPLLV